MGDRKVSYQELYNALAKVEETETDKLWTLPIGSIQKVEEAIVCEYEAEKGVKSYSQYGDAWFFPYMAF